MLLDLDPEKIENKVLLMRSNSRSHTKGTSERLGVCEYSSSDRNAGGLMTKVDIVELYIVRFVVMGMIPVDQNICDQ